LSPANKQSLSQFTRKLGEKHQSPEQQQHAAHAVSLYYELMGFGSEPLNHHMPVPLKIVKSKGGNGGRGRVLADLDVPVLARMFERRRRGYKAIGYHMAWPCGVRPG
jgi:hypothetical protein